MGRRGPKPQFTPDDLLDVAMTIGADEGLPALSMSALARRLGTSVSGLYRYVSGREAILVGLQERAIGDYSDRLRAHLDATDTQLDTTATQTEVAALVRVLATFGYYLQHAEDAPAEHRVLDAMVSEPNPLLSDDDARRVDASLDAVLGRGVLTLEAAATAGAIKPGDALQRTYLLWAGLHGLDHFRKRDRILPDRLKVQALRPAMLSNTLRGFGAKEETLAAALAHHGASVDEG